jgi:4-diphosphocytidyl-2-C-methyl-D-erythritol kinase
MQGVGEVLTPLPLLPSMWMVLANPRVPVATPQVFAALTARDNPLVPGLPAAALRSAKAFAAWLAMETRNDLAAAAHRVAPVLSQVEAALASLPGCLLARMSGSGGTHFGLFAGQDEARLAARQLGEAHPAWWVTAAPVLAPPDRPEAVAGLS